MKCDEATTLLMDRLAGDLDAAKTAALEGHLETCAGCRAEVAELGTLWRELGELPTPEPDPRLRRRFARWLEAERQALAAPRGWRRLVAGLSGALGGGGRGELRAAWAAAALLVGVLLGARLGGGGGEMQELRQEVRSLSHLVTVSMLAQDSASARLQGVSLSRLASDDPRVVAALLAAMAEDRSVNVRLAAIDALADAARRPAVREQALAALPAQDSPLVQIALVDLVLAGDGAAARRELAALLDDAGLHEAVRGHLAARLGQSI